LFTQHQTHIDEIFCKDRKSGGVGLPVNDKAKGGWERGSNKTLFAKNYKKKAGILFPALFKNKQISIL
jgi:hypothetical protein